MMAFSQFIGLSIAEIEAHFTTDSERGLTSSAASSNLARDGYNILANSSVSWWDILLRQFKSAFVYLLIAASLISFVLGERIDAALILLFIVINAALGFYQE